MVKYLKKPKILKSTGKVLYFFSFNDIINEEKIFGGKL